MKLLSKSLNSVLSCVRIATPGRASASYILRFPNGLLAFQGLFVFFHFITELKTIDIRIYDLEREI